MGHTNHIHEYDDTQKRVEGFAHEHSHAYPHPENTAHQTSGKEIIALLTFMIQHNEHHAQELADLLDALPPNARKKMMIPIGSLEAANVELQIVPDCLE